MHWSSMKSVERTRTEAGLDAFHSVVVDRKKNLKLVNFRYCPVRGYEAVSWACQSWTIACCHTLGMSFQGSFVVIVFHHAIWVHVPISYCVFWRKTLNAR